MFNFVAYMGTHLVLHTENASFVFDVVNAEWIQTISLKRVCLSLKQLFSSVSEQHFCIRQFIAYLSAMVCLQLLIVSDAAVK